MPIPGPFTPAVLSAGVVTNIASDILKHHAQALEGTLVGRMLKSAGLVEPDFDDRLHDALSKALTLYFETYPQYRLSGITAFFRDPAVARQIGGYILDRKPIDQDQIQHALDRHLRSDGTTRVLMKQHGLEPARIVPDFLECYRRVLNEQLSVPQMAILLEIVDQTATVIAEMRASEGRLKAYIAQLLESKLSPDARRSAYRTGQQELATDLIEEEEPIPTHTLKNQRPHVLVIGHVLDVDAECIEWDSPEHNVADYDVVIMDLTTAHSIQLPPPGAYSRQPRFQVDISKHLQWPNIQLSVEKLLRSGGKLFVIARPEIAVHPDSPRGEVYNSQSSSLLPFVFLGEQVSGQSITQINSRFEFYVRQMGKWNFVLNGRFLENFSEEVKCQVHPIAKNRADEMLALAVSVQGIKSKTPGVLYLLPPPTKIQASEAIRLVLEHLEDLGGFWQQRAGQAQPYPTSPTSMPVGMSEPTRTLDAAVLRRVLVERFDLEELRTLCFDLGVDYDGLRGEGKQAKARELIAYMQRRGQLVGLIAAIGRERGDIL